ncbi:MAG: superoxide dismutase [Pseudomonadales bacterium]
MSFKLKPLPYQEHALEPVIGRETVSIHYHKHHGGYVAKLNDVLDGNQAAQPLESVIETAREQEDRTVFNLAAQIWNHDFYWTSMTPETTSPDGIMHEHIEQAFSSMAGFEEAFKTAALNEFGSGWTWLCWNRDAAKLEVLSTTDAVLPRPDSCVALLTLDVWEHAYYLDYRNDRKRYIEQFLAKLIDWQVAGERLDAALSAATRSSLRQAAR